jgi:dienelactone hydrolase
MKATIAGILIFPVLVFAQARDGGRIKPIPPPGNELPAAERAELEAGAATLAKEIQTLKDVLKDKPQLLALLPDVQIYHKAVDWPLRFGELIDSKAARAALAEAQERIAQLRAGDPKWIHVTGVRAYVSKIDDSIQPYLLFVPANYKPDDRATKQRFDFWCHGRGEDLMELKFIRSKPEPAPKNDHFVVSLYGRYCNANKFAGEIDCLEALEDVKRRYSVDENRLVNIGFSMGGAATWQFAVHYSDLWAATSPGAGFSESREFLRIPQAEVDAMTPWQRALWHWYDCTDWAANLSMVPTLAYAGELDGQKQASDAMLRAMKEQGLDLERYIGPQTKHQYHKETRAKMDERLAEICEKGRNPVPDKVRFTTWTLRYDRMYWVRVGGIEKHWERATVEAAIAWPDRIAVQTTNVRSLGLDVPPGKFAPGKSVRVTIDGTMLTTATDGGGRLAVYLVKANGVWSNQSRSNMDRELSKLHGLQGPIDDAFMDAFLIVAPSGKGLNEKTDAWTKAELAHAVEHWRKQFRGEARVKRDDQVTDDDIRRYHLVCFGDPSSNKVIGKIKDALPARWSGQKLELGNRTYDTGHHMPAVIYPNPLNLTRYIVLNSGFTFREFDYLNNARQTPKLADWAVIDVDEPITPEAPGKIVDGGFFDERWRPQ